MLPIELDTARLLLRVSIVKRDLMGTHFSDRAGILQWKEPRPRKLTKAKADALNRKRDLVEGHRRSFEVQVTRVRAGRGQTVKE